MTEFSRNSRNQGAYTESNTVERSKEGPTHPYSGNQSDSASQYSGGSREEGIEDTQINFQINLQYIMPLISTIKEQNQHLKDQKAAMQKDMTNLNKLSKNLLSENQQLRKHYCSRTSDIKKLIQTISINTHEEVEDINHQCFLVKESNCLLVKKIEGLIRDLQEKGMSNEKKKLEMDELAKINVNVDQACRDIQVNNKQLEYRCQQAQLSSNKIDLSPEDQQLNQLLADVVAIKNSNKANIRKAKLILAQHTEEKPAIEDNLANIKTKNAELQGQALELQEKMKAAESEMQEKKEIAQQSSLALRNAMRNYEREKNALAQAEQQLVRKKEAITENGKRTKVASEKLEQAKKEKEKYRQMIAIKKEEMKKKEEERRKEQADREMAHKKQLKKIRDNLGQQEASANEEICSKLNPESTMVQSSIVDSKEEFASLVQQVDELRQGLSKLSNPLKEIVRAEYELRKRRVVQK